MQAERVKHTDRFVLLVITVLLYRSS